MLIYLLAMTVPVTAVALLYARWEYGGRGKLSLLGLFLLCVMLFLPNLVLEYATGYEMPSTALDYFGVLVGFIGIALCLAALLVVAISLYLLILIEEDHLHQVFGDQYVEFCRKIPRYLG